MPRPAKHDENSILAAAAAIVASKGPKAATITAIGHSIGAPSGSIYHRFQTRDELLGRLWLNKAAFFQNRWKAALDLPDPRKAGLAAALSLPQAVREDLKGARIMLLHRREDFLGETWPAEMRAEASRLKDQVEDSLARIAKRLFDKNSGTARQVATFAVLDVPFAAVRRFVEMGQVPPSTVDELITQAYRAIISQHRPKL